MKMTVDIKAAVDAIHDFDILDQSNVFLYGYALGGTVALLAAGLRFLLLSLHFDLLEQVDGLKNYSHCHGLIPRLGFFKNHPQRLPMDFPEIISTLAPRPVFVLAFKLDGHADLERLKAAINLVQQYYDRKGSDDLMVKYPIEVNRFTPEHQ